MSVSAYAPLLLPGYFHAPRGERPSGAAVTLQEGVLTTIGTGSASDWPPPHSLSLAPPPMRAARTSFRLNGQNEIRKSPLAPLLHSFLPEIDDVPLKIEQTTLLPDLGAPLMAARALSLALALNAWCSSPYSPAHCARLAQETLCRHQPMGLGVHLHGGLLQFSSSRSKPHTHLLTPRELRLPIRLSYFGRAGTPAHSKRLTSLSKSTRLLTQRALRHSNHIFHSKHSLLSLAAASRHFALHANSSRFWASALLTPRPLAGCLPGIRSLFEPGVGSPEPMVQPLRGSPPYTLIVHPSNHGARVL